MSNLTLALQHADKIEQMLIESGGEITPEIESEMAINPQTIGELVDIRYMGIERLEKSQEFFKAKAEEFQRIARSIDSALDFIQGSIKQYMIDNDKKVLPGHDYQFKLANAAPKVKVVNEDSIDPIYKKEKIEIQIDRKKIADDLKNGIPVDGCVLEEVYSLRKSVNKGK